MNLRIAAKLIFSGLLMVAVLAAGSDMGKSVTVKGYVLDSACAFTKGIKKPISTQCRSLREGRIAASDPDRRRQHLLAHRRHHAVLQPKRKAAALGRTKSHRQRQGLPARRIECIGDRQDRRPEIKCRDVWRGRPRPRRLVRNVWRSDRPCEVFPDDPAFLRPSQPASV